MKLSTVESSGDGSKITGGSASGTATCTTCGTSDIQLNYTGTFQISS